MADPIKVTDAGGQTVEGVPGGTTPNSEVPQGTPAQTPSVANELDPTALLAKLQQAEEDRKRVQATKDREVAAEKQRAAQLAQQLEELRKQGMTDQERIAYERDQYKAQLEQLQATERQRADMDAYVNALRAKGVDTSKLDMSSPEALANSGWEALSGLVDQLQTQLKTPAQQTPQPPQNNSRVITGSGGVPAKQTQSDLMKALGVRNTDELYRWAEHNPQRYNQWLQDNS